MVRGKDQAMIIHIDSAAVRYDGLLAGALPLRSEMNSSIGSDLAKMKRPSQ
jgi:hypothetical protein